MSTFVDFGFYLPFLNVLHWQKPDPGKIAIDVLWKLHLIFRLFNYGYHVPITSLFNSKKYELRSYSCRIWMNHIHIFSLSMYESYPTPKLSSSKTHFWGIFLIRLRVWNWVADVHNYDIVYLNHVHFKPAKAISWLAADL